MLDRPDVADEAIAQRVRDEYGLDVRAVEFLALGADAGAAAFRIECADRVVFAKLRRGIGNGTDPGAAAESLVALPAFLAESAGPTRVLGPLRTGDGRLATSVVEFGLVLYPFIDGTDGFNTALTTEQWTCLGQALAAVHSVTLPPLLAKGIRVEDYSPKWRHQLGAYLDKPDHEWPADDVAQELLATLHARRADLTRILVRAEELAVLMEAAEPVHVLCHGDIHAGNVMLAEDGSLFVVDWDNPVLAPRERDLMYIGAGIAVWSDAEDFTAFHGGYGPYEPDLAAIAYYRCDRIVEDSALFCADILASDQGGEDRAQNLRYFLDQFRTGSVIDCADAAYERYIASS